MQQRPRSSKAPITAEELTKIDLCRQLPDPVRANIAKHASRLQIDAGGEIIDQTDTSGAVFFLLEGLVRVNIAAASGRQITYQLLESGQIFGELSAIDNQPRTAGVYAENDIVLAKLDAEAFKTLLKLHPEFSMAIIRRLVGLSRWLSEKVFEYHAYDVKGRIYSELLRLSRGVDGTEITLTDRDMASRVGTTRENVTRIYADLKRKEILSRRQTAITILDTEQLHQLLTECEFG